MPPTLSPDDKCQYVYKFGATCGRSRWQHSTIYYSHSFEEKAPPKWRPSQYKWADVLADKNLQDLHNARISAKFDKDHDLYDTVMAEIDDYLAEKSKTPTPEEYCAYRRGGEVCGRPKPTHDEFHRFVENSRCGYRHWSDLQCTGTRDDHKWTTHEFVEQKPQTNKREATPEPKTDLTIREFQTKLPWTIKYSEDFRANPQSHKDFAHAVTHVVKAVGHLATVVDDFDHRRASMDDRHVASWLADLVICALRAANTHPGGVIDLQTAVLERIEKKNSVKL